MDKINQLLFFLNKINFYKYRNSDNDEKIEYVRRIVKVNFGTDDFF